MSHSLVPPAPANGGVRPPEPVVAAMGLSEQAAFLTTILESSTEYSIIAKDLDGLILAWNEGARRVYGYEADVFSSRDGTRQMVVGVNTLAPPVIQAEAKLVPLLFCR